MICFMDNSFFRTLEKMFSGTTCYHCELMRTDIKEKPVPVNNAVISFCETTGTKMKCIYSFNSLI